MGVGIIAFPTLYIMPFKPQASRTMQWALAARTMAPTVTRSRWWLSLGLGRAARHAWLAALVDARAGDLLVLIPSRRRLVRAAEPLRVDVQSAEAARVTSTPPKATFVHNDDIVMAVNIKGAAVAYPILQLAYHHIVNDVVAGEPIVATY